MGVFVSIDSQPNGFFQVILDRGFVPSNYIPPRRGTFAELKAFAWTEVKKWILARPEDLTVAKVEM